MKLLEEKVALITGANGGIGRAIAELFAENGATLCMHARKPSDEFESLIESLAHNYDINVMPVYFDLTDDDAIGSGLRAVARKAGSIDVLVNNAGAVSGGSLRMVPVQSLRYLMQVNFFAPILLMQLVSSLMVRRGSGSIVNMASVGGIEAQPGYLAYGSSKAALIWATRCLAKELGPHGVRVNAVAPGMTRTGMGGAYKTEGELKAVVSRTGLRRMAEPREIAEAVLFLASDSSSFVNGEILSVDGGRL